MLVLITLGQSKLGSQKQGMWIKLISRDQSESSNKDAPFDFFAEYRKGESTT